MPLNSNFRLPRGQRFFQKNGSYGYGAKSRCGSPRVHLGTNGGIGSKKWVKAIKKYHAPNFEFSTTPQSSIFHKKWKLRLWRQITVGTPRVHLGVNEVPLGPKNGSKPWKNTMPQNSNFRLSRVHRFFTKNGSYGYGAKSRWGPPRGHLVANGVPLGPKNGSKP